MIRTPLLLALILSSATLPAQTFFIPKPVDGLNGMEQFISEELVFPPKALEKGIKGEVWLKFIVAADGSVQDLRVWKPLEHECDAEALRLAKLIQWLPGTKGDLPVDAEHSMVVKFDPKDYQKKAKKRRDLEAELAALPSSRSAQVFPAAHLDTPPQPVISDGTKGLPTWWQENLRYPPEALRRNIHGTLNVRFVVEPSGNISNMHAVNDLGGGCIPEAFRMLRSIQWTPGMVKDQRVRTQMEMEILFKLP